VRRKVPDDVGVVLVQTHVEPGGVDVVEVPEVATGDDVAQRPHRSVVLEGVSHHGDHTSVGGGVHDRRRVPDGGREGLLHHDVLAGGDGGQCQSRVSARRCRDHQRVHGVQRLLQGAEALQRRVGAHEGVRAVLAWVDHADLLHLRERAHRPDVLGPPVAGADDADPSSRPLTQVGCRACRRVCRHVPSALPAPLGPRPFGPSAERSRGKQSWISRPGTTVTDEFIRWDHADDCDGNPPLVLVSQG
jgi:hypothetical protein